MPLVNGRVGAVALFEIAGALGAIVFVIFGGGVWGGHPAIEFRLSSERMPAPHAVIENRRYCLNGNAVSIFISLRIICERTCSTPGSFKMKSSRNRL